MSLVGLDERPMRVSSIHMSQLGQRFFFWLALFFFFLMLLIPMTYQTERGVVLSVLLAAGGVYAFHGGWCLHKTIFFGGC